MTTLLLLGLLLRPNDPTQEALREREKDVIDKIRSGRERERKKEEKSQKKAKANFIGFFGENYDFRSNDPFILLHCGQIDQPKVFFCVEIKEKVFRKIRV